MGKLIQIFKVPKHALIFLFLAIFSTINDVCADNSLLISTSELKIISQNESSGDQSATRLDNLNTSTAENLPIDPSKEKDSILEMKKLAFEYAYKDDAEMATLFIEKYIQATLNTNFINNEAFWGISESKEYADIAKKYQLNFGFLKIFYLFSAIIGMFIFIILNLKRTSKEPSNMLISSFVLMHSIFIFHIFLFLTNLKFRYPHTLFMSIIFSFLYGPLIYFYFKKITQQYKFRRVDLLHLIPTLVIIIAVFPIYMLPAEEKLEIMLNVGSIDRTPYVVYTFTAKLLSLIIYGYLTLRIYFRTLNNKASISGVAVKWQKSLMWLGMTYILSYAVYGLIISKAIPRVEFIYHLQILAMAGMVLYIGLIVYLKPKLFSSSFFEGSIYKYIKSGLTQSYSQELKEKLLFLLEEEKIYRQNDINLETLSQKLDTTRHNASQIINEHFGLNFFELINKFRIVEALEILKNDTHKNLNIIDVAYEVGFNNKVTFNKSFKKILSQTPSQYLISLRT